MPRDYKNTPRPRAKSARKRNTPSVPPWIWLGGILVLGIAIGLAAPRLLGIAQHGVSRLPRKTPQPAPRQSTAKPAPEAKNPADRFDFYKMLPKFQVVIPRQDKDVQTDTGNAPVAKPGAYVLQVASFQHYKDADAMKARLALLGVESHIQQVKVDGNQTWNRVRIGPISDLAKLNATRKTLASHHFEPLLIRIR